MASNFTVRLAKSATLSTTTVDTVTLGQVCSEVEIVNKDATNDLFITLNGLTPTASGDDCYRVLPATSKRLKTPSINPLVVSLIGSGNIYTVAGIP